MTILPAIDLKGGRCVRLRQGNAADETVYCDDPVEQALEWKRQGAEELHVVDLDGAFSGARKHAEIIEGVIRAFGAPVEVGGGLRTIEAVESVLNAGAARAILGSAALENEEFLKRAVDVYGHRIAVGIDARGGLVQTKGWVETTQVRAVDFAMRCDSIGVGRIIYTDTATDGMLGGPNLEQMVAVCKAAPHVLITASGGVSAPRDVANLMKLGFENLDSAIVGKALYDGRTTLKEMQDAAHG